jgi:hypothetical protein
VPSNALTRALSRVVEPARDAAPLAVKVPEVTALFWIIKITSTATGESLSDFLDGPSNVVIAGVASASTGRPSSLPSRSAPQRATGRPVTCTSASSARP